MNSMLTTLGAGALGLALATAPVAATAQPISGNLRVVVGSTSTGGDTYQNASIVAEALGQKLGVNVKVDPVGATEAFKAITRDTRGNTVMIFHDQSYLGNLYGVRGYDDIFETYRIGPTVAINPGNAYLVPKKSPYQTIEDVIAAAGEGKRVRVAIEPGGVSEIGFSALKNAVRAKHPGSEGNVVAINTGSQADKNQLLFDGQADVIHGSVQANEQYTRLPETDQKAMRFVWLTSSRDVINQANPEGIGETGRDDMLKYVEPNTVVPRADGQPFVFDKDFFFIYNAKMSDEAVAAIDQALAGIYADGKIQTTQKNAFFIPNFKPSGEAHAYLQEKRDQYRQIIEAIRQ
ncbi:ABC transporter substrate-binding protein [Azospirillum halopraeferens]|uniref:ABC transporter substrate-binding protein n=1 Tax=Azospirillum halopraeferens TaxID=34010 RepID=UPI000403991F|nr:ABC transporter substrate-binding protein [Azospirillum halopraeferens]